MRRDGQILLKCRANTLMEYHPTKILNILKETLLDIIPMDIITTIDNYIIVFKYKDKHKIITL